MVRIATAEDTEKIFSIAQENSLYHNRNNGGFLVSDYNINDYDYFIANNRIYVLDEEGIKAFVLIFKGGDLDRKQATHKRMLAHHKNSNFLLIKQICVEYGSKKNGYGRRLYEYLIENYNLDIFANIVMEPANTASVKFHESMGFGKVFEMTPEDGIKRHAYMRRSPQ